MPYIRHVYHVTGVTDLGKFLQEAEERARHGSTTVVHRHGAAKPCSDRCMTIEPTPAKEA